jgi:DNA-binding MarR family transcriptional regulator
MVDDSPTISQVLAVYTTVARMLDTAVAPVWDALDTSLPQIKVLFIVSHQGPITIGRLAQTLAVGQSTASQLVDAVSAAGYVARMSDPADGRRTLVHLTEQGAACIRELRYGASNYLETWIARLTIAERAALYNGLSALVQAASDAEIHGAGGFNAGA